MQTYFRPQCILLVSVPLLYSTLLYSNIFSLYCVYFSCLGICTSSISTWAISTYSKFISLNYCRYVSSVQVYIEYIHVYSMYENVCAVLCYGQVWSNLSYTTKNVSYVHVRSVLNYTVHFLGFLILIFLTLLFLVSFLHIPSNSSLSNSIRCNSTLSYSTFSSSTLSNSIFIDLLFMILLRLSTNSSQIIPLMLLRDFSVHMHEVSSCLLYPVTTVYSILTLLIYTVHL